MAISTNSIIHYTDAYEAVTGILKEGFRVKYCIEKLRLDKKVKAAAHPMVSFCDIPLSDSSRHFAAYGEYGIGLSKAWAMDKGINPVVYIDHNSLFAKSIAMLLDDTKASGTNLTKKQKEEIIRIKSYAKNYSGPLKRKAIDDKNYKFYDEREWRLIPGSDVIGSNLFSVAGSKYEENKDEFNSKIVDARLTFSAKDISYIIVSDTEEIPRIISFIRSVYSGKCTADELDVLFSKVCSTRQIMDDY